MKLLKTQKSTHWTQNQIALKQNIFGATTSHYINQCNTDKLLRKKNWRCV